MKKIIILASIALIIRFILIVYYIPVFEKTEISENIDSLKVYKFLSKINSKRPFQSNKDIQYFSKKDLNNNFVKKAYSNRSIRMNDDEEQNYAIAVNFLNGNNYSIFDTKNQKYRLTAQQHSFQVFLYKYFIDRQINFDYFIFLFIFVNLFLFFLSIIFFYKISLIYLNKLLSKISTLTYCLYPSIFFYIGPLFFYENIVLSLIIISSYFFMKKNNYLNFLIIIPFAVLSLLLRFQTIFIWILFFTFFTLRNFYNYRKLTTFIPFLLFILLAFVAHKPILEKNFILFGKSVLTTNTGVGFYIGANKFARGSWDGTGKVTNQFIDNLDNNLNDLEIGKIYISEGIKWIQNNPSDYFILQIKKIAIYFLPQNYSILPLNRIYNPLNLLIHLGFLIFIINVLIKKDFTYRNFIIISPIIGSLLISILFFVGYRWRYYAEPFIILTAFICLYQYLKLNNNKLK